MPHSSEGESNSGGSHSGSESILGGHTTIKSDKAVSKKFPGAQRYIYFENNKPVYIWANYDITKTKQSRRKVTKLIIALLFWVLSVVLQIHNPKALDWSPEEIASAGQETIVIKDDLNLFSDTTGLSQAMSDFYEQTKIRPAIITVKEESWINNYDSLEIYAYELYVNMFEDEKHWLIVYSVPQVMEGEFQDWKWEGMQGKDTDNILSVDASRFFNRHLQKYLLQKDKYSVEEALAMAFTDLNQRVMQVYISKGSIILSILFLALIILVFLFAFGGFHPNKEEIYRSATLCPENFNEHDNCEYCGTEYLIGFHKKCPGCGAPLKAHDFTTDSQGNITGIIN
ncbi:MAG: hypothetical protein K6E78_09615 [Treponema sp.]|nr:hypothetical protein [Treponema sp.]